MDTETQFFDIALGETITDMGLDLDAIDADRPFGSVPITEDQREAVLDLLERAIDSESDPEERGLLSAFRDTLDNLTPQR